MLPQGKRRMAELVPPVPTPTPADPGRRALAWLQHARALTALLLLLLFNAIFTRDFLTLQTLNVNLSQVAQVVVVAMGMAIVIATAGIDLSVGAVAAFAGTLAAVLLTDAAQVLAHTGLTLPVALLLPLLA